MIIVDFLCLEYVWLNKILTKSGMSHIQEESQNWKENPWVDVVTREVPKFYRYWLTIAYAPACCISWNFQNWNWPRDRSVFRSVAEHVLEQQKYKVDFCFWKSSWRHRILWSLIYDRKGGSRSFPTRTFLWFLSPLRTPARRFFKSARSPSSSLIPNRRWQGRALRPPSFW